MLHLSQRVITSVSCAIFLFISALPLGVSTAQAQQLNKVAPEVKKQAKVDYHGEDMEGKDGPLAAVGLDLALLYHEYQNYKRAKTTGPFEPQSMLGPSSDDGLSSAIRGKYVLVDAVARESGPELESELKEIGAKKISRYKHVVSALMPVDSIPALADLSSMRSVSPAQAIENVTPGNRDDKFGVRSSSPGFMPGSVISEGDEAMNTDDVRDNLGIDGAGVAVGVLSDSYDQAPSNIDGGVDAADDRGSDDLPPANRINILDDNSDTGDDKDEGRAMMQKIHDVAPGSDLAFHEADDGTADFAGGIEELRDNAGAGVIVDDISYPRQPFFQDGIVAQAVDEAVTDGAAYFSSAGNRGRDSYETTTWAMMPNSDFYNFNSGGQADSTQTISLQSGDRILISVQWDDPWFSVTQNENASADTDLGASLVALESKGQVSEGDLLAESDEDNANSGSSDPFWTGDPVEVLSYENPTNSSLEVGLRIEINEGPDPGRLKHIIFSLERFSRISEYDTESSTLVAHHYAERGAGVAAAYHEDTPAFGTDPAEARDFTSLGGTPILFDVDGNRLTSPEIRDQPRFTGPDGTNTTFFGTDIEGDGFPNFSGTSAAAPHVAALAALQRQADPGLPPSEVYSNIENGAEDMTPASVPNPSGFDRLTGHGFVNAENTITSVETDLQITFNEVRAGFFPTITSVVTVTDSDGDVVTGLEGASFSLQEEGASESIVDVDEIRESGGNVSSSLVLDRSGSMGGRKLGNAKEAAKTFVEQLTVGDQASVISFSFGVSVDQPFTPDVETLKSAIDANQGLRARSSIAAASRPKA